MTVLDQPQVRSQTTATRTWPLVDWDTLNESSTTTAKIDQRSLMLWTNENAVSTSSTWLFVPDLVAILVLDRVGGNTGESRPSLSPLKISRVGRAAALTFFDSVSPSERLAKVYRSAISESTSPRAILGALRWLHDTAGLSWIRIARLMNVSRQAVYDWQRGDRLSAARRTHLMSIENIVRCVYDRYQSAEMVSIWLDTPMEPDGALPSNLLRDGEFERAKALVDVPLETDSGPAWWRWPVAPTYQSLAERRSEGVPPEPDVVDC